MGKKKRISLPQTGAGLVRYFDEYHEKIKIKPEHVIGFIVVLIIIEIALKFYFL